MGTLAERAELVRRSDELATNILESVSDQQRSVLTAAMRQVEQLLRASMITFGIEPPTTPDAQTNRALHEAIHLYRRSGYVEVEAFNAEPYSHHWF
jgi:hypothetical protein